jgi:ubiquinone biosynthesis protein
MWVVSEPVVKAWMEQTLGPGAQFEAAAEGAASVGRFMGEIPKLLGQAERTAEALTAMAEDGLRLDDHTVERLAEAQARESRAGRIGIWIGAIALAAIALALLFCVSIVNPK